MLHIGALSNHRLTLIPYFPAGHYTNSGTARNARCGLAVGNTALSKGIDRFALIECVDAQVTNM